MSNRRRYNLLKVNVYHISSRVSTIFPFYPFTRRLPSMAISIKVIRDQPFPSATTCPLHRAMEFNGGRGRGTVLKRRPRFLFHRKVVPTRNSSDLVMMPSTIGRHRFLFFGNFNTYYTMVINGPRSYFPFRRTINVNGLPIGAINRCFNHPTLSHPREPSRSCVSLFRACLNFKQHKLPLCERRNFLPISKHGTPPPAVSLYFLLCREPQ